VVAGEGLVVNAIYPLPLRFTEADSERAHAEWGANCGPHAIAVVCGLTLDELRPHMGDFEAKHYTNPSLLWAVLKRLGARHRALPLTWPNTGTPRWPEWGLARIQWEGPWTEPGVPVAAAYRHTHWVAVAIRDGNVGINDVNCMNNGTGWVAVADWVQTVVPHLTETIPRATGGWHPTHLLEVRRANDPEAEAWFRTDPPAHYR